MSNVSATFASRDEAEAAKARLLGIGVAENAVRITDANDGTYTVAADVHASELVRAEEVIRRSDHEQSAQHTEGQAIAPGGDPIGAVGSTNNMPMADDDAQTYRDPLEPRDT